LFPLPFPNQDSATRRSLYFGHPIQDIHLEEIMIRELSDLVQTSRHHLSNGLRRRFSCLLLDFSHIFLCSTSPLIYCLLFPSILQPANVNSIEQCPRSAHPKILHPDLCPSNLRYSPFQISIIILVYTIALFDFMDSPGPSHDILLSILIIDAALCSPRVSS
jgi:hypothetical protein